MKVGLGGAAIIALVVGIVSMAAANGEEPGSAEAALYRIFGVIGLVGCTALLAVAFVAATKGRLGKRRKFKSRTSTGPRRKRNSRRRR